MPSITKKQIFLTPGYIDDVAIMVTGLSPEFLLKIRQFPRTRFWGVKKTHVNFRPQKIPIGIFPKTKYHK